MAKLTFKDLASEEAIMQVLGVNAKALAELRNKERLPYVRVNRNSRLYLVPDVMAWLQSRTCSGKISCDKG